MSQIKTLFRDQNSRRKPPSRTIINETTACGQKFHGGMFCQNLQYPSPIRYRLVQHTYSWIFIQKLPSFISKYFLRMILLISIKHPFGVSIIIKRTAYKFSIRLRKPKCLTSMSRHCNRAPVLYGYSKYFSLSIGF